MRIAALGEEVNMGLSHELPRWLGTGLGLAFFGRAGSSSERMQK
jgi:hypothetical protein